MNAPVSSRDLVCNIHCVLPIRVMVKSINVTEIEWTNKLLRQVSGQSS